MMNDPVAPSAVSRVVSRDEWLLERLALLEQEKALTRHRDEVARKRRALPRVRIDTPYVFAGPDGESTLLDLFDGKRQLITYHFMYGPDWQEGCKSCSFWADQYDAISPHLAARDVAIAAVSRAPWQAFQAFKSRMGWRFNWVSSAQSTFNHDFAVSFPGAETGNYNYRETSVREEMPGLSVFLRQDDAIYHTYSCYSRGLDALNAAYQMLDLVPFGRNEDDLAFSMAWVQHHDRYGD